MQGKTCLVTGADSGIGKAIAKLLAREGYHLILISSSEEKLKVIQDEIISETNNHQIDIHQVDLSLQSEIRSFCDDFINRYPKLDVLINNAGVNLPFRQLTSEGFEYMFAVNHLAPFLLTNLLIEVFKRAESARIINIGSNGEKWANFDFENLQGEKSFDGMRQYCLTKLCNLMFSYELARILKDSQITVICLHPSGVRTGIMRYYKWFRLSKMIWFVLFPFLKKPEKAAGYVLDLVENETSLIHGQYFSNGKSVRSSDISMDENLSKQLWKYSADTANI